MVIAHQPIRNIYIQRVHKFYRRKDLALAILWKIKKMGALFTVMTNQCRVQSHTRAMEL